MLAVNLKGCFLAARAALPVMRGAAYGRMIFTSSITGPRVTSPGHGHYSAIKAGINGFIRAAALEFAGYGITVNGVEPGNILTEGMQLHRSAAFIRSMEDDGAARPARHAARRRQRRRCSSPPTRPPTSPAPRSSSTAARSCPKAPTSASSQGERREPMPKPSRASTTSRLACAELIGKTSSVPNRAGCSPSSRRTSWGSIFGTRPSIRATRP